MKLRIIFLLIARQHAECSVGVGCGKHQAVCTTEQHFNHKV